MIPKRKKISDSVVEEIVRMMNQGELAVGDRLPDQIQFAKQLGVSRLSLREGLHTLQMIGVVEQKPKIGTIILNDKPETWLHKINTPLLSDKAATLELLEARMILETEMAALLVDRATEEDVTLIRHTIDDMELCKGNEDVEGYLLADVDFHKRLAFACHNRYLINMLENVMSLLQEFMREYFHEMPTLLPVSLELHKKIYEALIHHDQATLVHSMGMHLKVITSATENYYKKNEANCTVGKKRAEEHHV